MKKLLIVLAVFVFGVTVVTLLDEFAIGIVLDNYAFWQRIAHQALYVLWGGLLFKVFKVVN